MVQQDHPQAQDQAALDRIRKAFNDPDATEEFNRAVSAAMRDEAPMPRPWDDSDPEC
jgi:hypothetical protein